MLEHEEACERLPEGAEAPPPPEPVPKWVPLAADDFLPIFIFVVVQCSTQAAMPAPMRTRDLLWALADDTHLQSEAGYYLTMFEAALEFLKNLMLAAQEKEAALSRLAGPTTKNERGGTLFSAFSVQNLKTSAGGAVRRISVRAVEHTRSRKDLVN